MRVTDRQSFHMQHRCERVWGCWVNGRTSGACVWLEDRPVWQSTYSTATASLGSGCEWSLPRSALCLLTETLLLSLFCNHELYTVITILSRLLIVAQHYRLKNSTLKVGTKSILGLRIVVRPWSLKLQQYTQSNWVYLEEYNCLSWGISNAVGNELRRLRRIECTRFKSRADQILFVSKF